MNRVILLLALFGLSTNALIAADLPEVEVLSVRRVFHNGEHNAFTDLCRFGDDLYLTFRSCPGGHGVNPAASIIVLKSTDDGQTWKQVFQFSVPKRDTRDPHFLAFKGKLFVYTGAWYCGDSAPKTYDMNQHLGYAAWLEPGKGWQGPRMLEGTYGHYIWRAATDGQTAFLCGRRKHAFREVANRAQRDPIVESALLASDDGLIWHYRGLFQSDYGDETAFQFQPDGSILAIARSGSGRNAQVCRAKPPFHNFKRIDLDRYIGGPLVADWGKFTLVGGRKTKDGPARTALYWLDGDTLHEFAELPSGGDNSYPGFVDLGKGRALVSYYSSHEKDKNGKTITAIYLAELQIKPN